MLRTTTDEDHLRDFAHWCEQQPPERSYSFTAINGTCAVSTYMRERLGEDRWRLSEQPIIQLTHFQDPWREILMRCTRYQELGRQIRERLEVEHVVPA